MFWLKMYLITKAPSNAHSRSLWPFRSRKGKPQKLKSSFLNDSAIKKEVGGGVKGFFFFFTFFFILKEGSGCRIKQLSSRGGGGGGGGGGLRHCH